MAESKVKTPGRGLGAVLRRCYYFVSGTLLAVRWFIIELFSFQRSLEKEDDNKRPNKVAVVTGGNKGIGIQLIKKLLEKDMHLIMGVRDIEKSRISVENLMKDKKNAGVVEFHHLDLKSFASVRKFAQFVLSKHDKIHFLFNNAGVMACPYEVTEDGNESQLQVNHLSPFLLTYLLLPSLKNAAKDQKSVRIVNTASVSSYGGDFNFDDINSTKFYSPVKAYCNSKLAMVTYTVWLNDQLKAQGENIEAFSLHPGIIKTDLWKNLLILRYTAPVVQIFSKSAAKGAHEIVFAAFSSDLKGKGGSFLCNTRIQSPKSKFLDKSNQENLMKLSYSICKISRGTNKQ